MDIIKKTVFFILLVLAIYSRATSQNYRTITVKNGLPHNNVFDVAEDADGLVWLGTENGLARFDGSAFEYFNKKDGLHSETVLSLAFDPYGNLWLGTMGGIAIKTKDNRIRHVNSPIKFEIYALLVDSFYAYVFSDLAVTVFELSTGKYKKIDNAKIEFANMLMYSMRPCHEGGVWFHGTDSLMHLNGFEQTIYTFPKPIKRGTLSGIYDNEKLIFVGLKDKLWVIEKSSNRIIQEITPPYETFGSNLLISENKRNKLCLGSRGVNSQIFIYEKDKDGRYQYTETIKNVSAGNIFMQKNKILFPTYGNGLIVYSDYIDVNKINLSGTNCYINSIWSDSDATLVGTSGGLFELDKDTFNRVNLSNSGNQMEYIRTIKKNKNGWAAANINNGKLNQKNQFWVNGKPGHAYYSRIIYTEPDWNDVYGTIGYSILHYPQNSGENIKHTPLPSFAKKNNIKINDMLVVNEYIILATSEGLMVYDKNFRWKGQYLKKEQFYFLQKHNQTYFAGSSAGLLVADRENGFNMMHSPIKRDEEFYCMARSGENLLVFGTNFGLVVWKSGHLYIVDEQEGLGLSHINAVAFDAHNGKLLIGGNNGIYELTFSASFFAEARRGPNVRLLNILCGKKTDFTLNYPISIEKNNGEKIVFNYSAVEYLNPQNLIYRYAINDQEYFTTKSNQAVLENISPGSYTFTLQASLNGLEWGKPQTIPFTVNPYIWQTRPFHVAVIICIMMCIYALYVLRIRYLKRLNAKELNRFRQINFYKTQILNSTINSHFIFNLLNSIKYLIYSGQNEKAESMLSLYVSLVRNTVNYSNRVFVLLSEELARLENYMELERKRVEGDLCLRIENELSSENPSIPNLLLQPFVENSILHGYTPRKEAYIIDIRISKSQIEGIFNIEIEDFGILPGKTSQNSSDMSVAIANIRERLEFLYAKSPYQSQLEVIDKSILGGAGYLVKIQIPTIPATEGLDE